MQRIRDELRRARHPALALFTAFLLGAILIVLTDFEHLRQIGTDPLAAIGGALAGVFEGYPAMFAGAIGDPGRIVAAIQSGDAEDIAAALRPISETLVSATPFIFAGLGLAVSFQAGLFNLGVDGQFLIGGLGAFITATLVAGYLPPLLALVVAVVGGTIAGGAYGFVPGFLKARTGAHEVITTLMLNGLAPSRRVPHRRDHRSLGAAGGDPRRAAAHRPADDPRRLRLRRRARDGRGRVVPAVPHHPRLRAPNDRLQPHRRPRGRHPARPDHDAGDVVSGGLVGMGSAFFGLGPAQGFSGGPTFDFGYLAVALALLAGRRPGGVVVVALLYGALTTGAKSMVIVTGIPLALLIVIVAFAIMFVAAPELTRSIWRLRAPKPSAETGANTPVGPDGLGRPRGITNAGQCGRLSGDRVEPTLGFEPRTCCLRNSCSTTELCRRGGQFSSPAAGAFHDRFGGCPHTPASTGWRGRKRASRCHTAGGTDVTRGSCIRERPGQTVR